MKSAKQNDNGKITKKVVLKIFKDYALITLGCIIYSFGIAMFLDVNKIAPGGISGIATVINGVLNGAAGEELNIGMNITGILIIVINIPLLICGAVIFGKKFTVSTIYATVVSSLLIELWNFAFDGYTEDLFLSALAGGALMGIGLGLIFRMNGSTAGTDIIIKLLRRKFRYIKTGVISLMIDFVIMAIAFAVFQNFKLACYTLIAIVVFTVLFDLVLYGGNSAKFSYIITTEERSAVICDRILKELDISATCVDGKGAYTGNDRRIIMCAAKNYLYPRLRDIVKEVDPGAFMIVSSAKEIYGEGYKDHFDEEL